MRLTLTPSRSPGKLVFMIDGKTLGLQVERTDPRVLLSDQITDAMRRGLYLIHPEVSLDGDMLTIANQDRRVIYRMGKADESGHYHFWEWPD